MARGRPAHLARRGAIYLVRFRLPLDLANAIGVAEYRRSLHTSNYNLARRRCLAATAWFRTIVEDLRRMKQPSKEALEAAAIAYFEQEATRERSDRYPEDELEIAVGYDVSLAHEAIRQVDVDLIRNEFSGVSSPAALAISEDVGFRWAELDQSTQQLALRLAARTVRELSLLLIHQLTDPTGSYVPHDPLFDGSGARRRTPSRAKAVSEVGSMTLQEAAEAFRLRLSKRELGVSALTELTRVLGWLGDRHGHDIGLADLSLEDLKAFRDDLPRVDKRLRGKKLPFDKRLTDNPQHQIGYATYTRYWRGLRQFFRWAVEDRLISTDPSAVSTPPRPKNTKQKSPSPFTTDELRMLFATPLYAGHKSVKQVKIPGKCVVRGGQWWSGVLLLHTGMRAGELSQLTWSDFVFDAEVPYLRVTDEGTVNGRKKTVKNSPSVRDVPLHPDLLTLGIRQFVERSGSSAADSQVFSVFRLGKQRSSAGATRFWGDYLRKHGLWRDGRATHVWRHTLAYFLRTNGVSEPEIAATVGHAGGETALGPSFAQTKAYGGDMALKRKLEIITRADFGIDVVEALGGPFDPARHRP